MVRKILLVCGILSSLLYLFEINILAPMQYPGYSLKSQVPSELFAVDAPSNTFLFRFLGILYTLLMVAFGVGVWQSAGGRRSVRLAGAALAASAIIGFAGSFFPMHQREVLAAGGATLSDTMHQIIYGAITPVFALLYLGLGSGANGRWFQIYSMVTILILLVSGGLLGRDVTKIAQNAPTPWVGLNERILIAAYMVWIIVLAVVLWRGKRTTTSLLRQ